MEYYQIILKKIKIKNFRCFEEVETDIESSLTTFIGSNSVGKSTMMEALLKLLSKNQVDRVIEKSDFFLRNKTMEQVKCSIEVLFEIPNPNVMHDDYPVQTYFKNGKAYIRARLDAALHSWGIISGVNYLDEEGNVVFFDIEGNLIRSDSLEGIELDRDGTVLRRLVEIIYIPAHRNSIKEIIFNEGTLLYEILQFTHKFPRDEIAFSEAAVNLNKQLLSSRFASDIQKKIDIKWSDLNPDPTIKRAMLTFTGINYESILQQTHISFYGGNSGLEKSISSLGDGLQSLFYITLVQVLLELMDEKRSYFGDSEFYFQGHMLIALEEPENHISPQILGKLITGFTTISKSSNVQIIMSTHSTSILKRINPNSIRLFRKSVPIKQISSWKDDEQDSKFLSGAIHNNPELYYSNLVILVEGESEEVILPHILKEAKLECDNYGISIVALGGAHYHHMWRLLNDLCIPYITLLDLDLEREGGGWGKIEKILSNLKQSNPVIKKHIDLTYYYGGRPSTDKGLTEMKSWPVNDKLVLQKWIRLLESYGVFFSYPLDFDLLMLESFSQEYKSTALNVPISSPLSAVRNVLGLNENESPISYSSNLVELMPWYAYLFLRSVGKPTRHRLALEKLIINERWYENIPAPLKRLGKKIKTILPE